MRLAPQQGKVPRQIADHPRKFGRTKKSPDKYEGDCFWTFCNPPEPNLKSVYHQNFQITRKPKLSCLVVPDCMTHPGLAFRLIAGADGNCLGRHSSEPGA